MILRSTGVHDERLWSVGSGVVESLVELLLFRSCLSSGPAQGVLAVRVRVLGCGRHIPSNPLELFNRLRIWKGAPRISYTLFSSQCPTCPSRTNPFTTPRVPRFVRTPLCLVQCARNTS